MRMARLVIEGLPEQALARLRALAEAESRPVASIARDLLSAALAEQAPPSPQSRLGDSSFHGVVDDFIAYRRRI